MNFASSLDEESKDLALSQFPKDSPKIQSGTAIRNRKDFRAPRFQDPSTPCWCVGPAENHDRIVRGILEHCSFRRQAKPAVEDDSHERPISWRMTSIGEARVIRESSANTNQNCIEASAQPLSELASLLGSDPAGLPRSSRDSAIQGHPDFSYYEREARGDVARKRLVEPFGFLFIKPNIHANSGRAQQFDSLPANSGIRIDHGSDNPLDSRTHQLLGAWWGAAVRRAGLQRHIGSGLMRVTARLPECPHLGVIEFDISMPTLSDDFPSANEDAANSRVGAGLGHAAPGEDQRTTHEFSIIRIEHEDTLKTTDVRLQTSDLQ